MKTHPTDLAFSRPFAHGFPEQNGLTKREYFAANTSVPLDFILKAIEQEYKDKTENLTMNEIFRFIAQAKVLAADTLIAELNKKHNQNEQ